MLAHEIVRLTREPGEEEQQSPQPSQGTPRAAAVQPQQQRQPGVPLQFQQPVPRQPGARASMIAPPPSPRGRGAGNAFGAPPVQVSLGQCGMYLYVLWSCRLGTERGLVTSCSSRSSPAMVAYCLACVTIRVLYLHRLFLAVVHRLCRYPWISAGCTCMCCDHVGWAQRAGWSAAAAAAAVRPWWRTAWYA